MVLGLLGVDLDGTLVRADGRIAAEDVAALAAARRDGIAPVIVTARFPSRSLEIARSVLPDLPLICADGALISRVDGTCQLARRLWQSELLRLYAICRRHGLRPFALGHAHCYFDPAHAAFFDYVAGWCAGSHVEPHYNSRDVVLLLGIGAEDAVQAALLSARRHCGPRLRVDTFQLAPSQMWALRCRRSNVSKAHAFAHLGRKLAIRRSAWAAVGNDLNDLPLFAAVPHAFAMADSPEVVQRAATIVLSASSHSGGALAEVLDYLRASGFATPEPAGN